MTAYGSILMRFSAIFFSESTALSDALHNSHFCRWVAPQFARKCGEKLRKAKNRLGEIELRAPAVGAKIGVFCMSRLVCLSVGT